MKVACEVLKNRPRVSVTLTRDSVCAGDDGDAPHEKMAETYSFVDPVAFAKALSYGYLPSVAGVGHSWTCVLNDVRIAQLAHAEVRPLVRATPFGEANRVHFVYHSSPY